MQMEISYSLEKTFQRVSKELAKRKRIERKLSRSKHRQNELDLLRYYMNDGETYQNFEQTFNNRKSYTVRHVKAKVRALHLARMFLRGREYHDVEQKYYTMPNFDMVREIVEQHSYQDSREILQRLENWISDGLRRFVFFDQLKKFD